MEPTNGEWTDVSAELTTVITGVKDLFFTFVGSGTSLFDFDSWQFGEKSTGIDGAVHLKNKEEIKEDNVYDLGGRRVTSPGKGVYIERGKKFIK